MNAKRIRYRICHLSVLVVCRLPYGSILPWEWQSSLLMGNFKVYTSFNKFASNCSFYLKSPKTQVKIWTLSKAPPTLWPYHQYTSKNYIWIYHGMHLTPWYRSQLMSHWKARRWLPWLSKKLDTPTKSRWSWAQFQKSSPTPCKTTHGFPLPTSGLHSFGNKSTSHKPWSDTFSPKF